MVITELIAVFVYSNSQVETTASITGFFQLSFFNVSIHLNHLKYMFYVL